MILSTLDIHHFRIIEQLKLAPHPTLNLISGDNGSGKSSLLEAIQCLAAGHSFRTRKAKELIHHAASEYRLTAVFSEEATQREHRAGLSRDRNGNVNLRLDYEDIKSQSTIARLLPVRAITPDSHRLIQEGPDERRQFLDWGLFHVEPQFHTHWKNFRRALSQRNQLLREERPDSDIASWNAPFIQAAVAMHEARQRYCDQLQDKLAERLVQAETMFHVKLRYRAGWDINTELQHLLQANLRTHRRMKTTTEGPHRADMIINSDDNAAKHVLSRGQQKVLVYLLILAQLDVMTESSNNRAIVLCDDLTSELDEHHVTQLITQLIELNSQVFVTGINTDRITEQPHESFQLRHGALENRL